MKCSTIVIIIFFTLSVLSGCFQDYKVYGFKSQEINFAWGTVSAKLRGREKITHSILSEFIGRKAIQSSPYELLIWFGSDTFMKGDIRISELRLVYAKDDKIVFEQNNIPDKIIEKYTDDYWAFFSFGGIRTEYADMILRLRFQLRQDGKSSEYDAEIYFEKDYKEFSRMIGV